MVIDDGDTAKAGRFRRMAEPLTGSVKCLHASLLARRLVTWESRWGRSIVSQYEIGVELTRAGGLGTLLLMSVYLVASGLEILALRIVALVLTFGGTMMVMVAGVSTMV